jgi:hypothetical protein
MLSAMATAAITHTKDDLPDTQNDAVALPQELSAFLAGRISSNVGLFSQFTYSGADGAFGIDNVDIRFANRFTVGSNTEVVYGLTLNNNPTVQDLWNTTPAWGYPFIGSEGAPGGAAAALIDGGLSQNVLGIGSAMIGNLLYGGNLDIALRSRGNGPVVRDRGDPWRRAVLETRIAEGVEEQYLMIGAFACLISTPASSLGARHLFVSAPIPSSRPRRKW